MLRKIRQMLKSQEGFTLVELMIVVVILGILAGIGIQQYGRVQERAREGVNDANLKMIANAVRLYQTMEGKDPQKSGESGEEEIGEEEIGEDEILVTELDLDGYGIESAQLKSPWGDEEEYVIKKEEGEGNLMIYLKGHAEYEGGTGGTIEIKSLSNGGETTVEP